MPMQINESAPLLEELIERALDEDLAGGDITSDALIPAHVKGKASFVVKADGILAGIDLSGLVYRKIDPFLKFSVLVKDGSRVRPGDIIASVQGDVPGILKGERTALNFLQHLSGIATQTSVYVDLVRGLPVKILDTRKTLPGLRMLEKYAVSVGGGTNHRMSLGDMVLIKDNHMAIMRQQGLGITEMVRRVRNKTPKQIKIEIETTNPLDASEAADSGADIVMLDNMGLEDMRKAVNLINHKAIVEASGGISLENIRSIAETGVDWISVGALTHSARALDISLDLAI